MEAVDKFVFRAFLQSSKVMSVGMCEVLEVKWT